MKQITRHENGRGSFAGCNESPLSAWQFKRQENKSIWIIWNEIHSTHIITTHMARIFRPIKILNGSGMADESPDTGTQFENVMVSCEALYNVQLLFYYYFPVFVRVGRCWASVCLSAQNEAKAGMNLHDLDTSLLLITYYAKCSKYIDLHCTSSRDRPEWM